MNKTSVTACIGFVALVVGLVFQNQTPTTEIAISGPLKQTVSTTVETSGFELKHRPIESIRVGMRVAAHNPELSDKERNNSVEPDPETWRSLSLVLPKPTGGALDIEMIRPQAWIDDHQATLGGSIYLDMPELGATGRALVVDVGPCPEIFDGPGEVVVSTFGHPASQPILDVAFSSDNSSEMETVGVTDNHPFWSVKHKAFRAIGQLEKGDVIQTWSGQTKRISSILARPGPAERVYNLEVNTEHVFSVGADGLLVHNNCGYFKNLKELHDALRDADGVIKPLITVLGKWDDVAEFLGKEGHNVLSIKDWNLLKNFQWLWSAYRRGDTFLIPNPQNLGKYSRMETFMLWMLRASGRVVYGP